MLHAVMEDFLGLVLDYLFALLWWVVLFPAVWLASLPFALVVALFRRERYSVAVRATMLAVHGFWKEWGFFLIP